MNDTISVTRMEVDDDDLDENERIKRLILPSNYVLKKHLMLIFSVITTMFTVISWYMGTTNWLWKHWTSWIVLIASLVTSTIAILASVSFYHSPISCSNCCMILTLQIDLDRKLLISYSVLGGIDLIVKILFVTYIEERLRQMTGKCIFEYDQCNGEKCTQVEKECYQWRLDDLNLTNSMVFQIFSCIATLTLVIFSIQLIIYKTQKPEGEPDDAASFDGTSATAGHFDYDFEDIIDGSNIDSISVKSDPGEDYGTFRRRQFYINRAFFSSPEELSTAHSWPRNITER